MYMGRITVGQSRVALVVDRGLVADVVDGGRAVVALQRDAQVFPVGALRVLVANDQLVEAAPVYVVHLELERGALEHAHVAGARPRRLEVRVQCLVVVQRSL